MLLLLLLLLMRWRHAYDALVRFVQVRAVDAVADARDDILTLALLLLDQLLTIGSRGGGNGSGHNGCRWLLQVLLLLLLLRLSLLVRLRLVSHLLMV